MGYSRAAALQHVRFRCSSSYPGLEIEARAPGLEAELAAPAFLAARSGMDMARAVRKLLGPFVACVSAWTLEDVHGRPVPVSVRALVSLDGEFLVDVMNAWLTATTPARSSQPPDPAGSPDPSEPVDPELAELLALDEETREIEAGLAMQPLDELELEPVL